MTRTTILTLPSAIHVTPPAGPAERIGSRCGRLVDRALHELATLLPAPSQDQLAGMGDANLRDIGLTRDSMIERPSRPLWLG